MVSGVLTSCGSSHAKVLNFYHIHLSGVFIYTVHHV